MAAEVPVIERTGGGSVRCMITELFHSIRKYSTGPVTLPSRAVSGTISYRIVTPHLPRRGVEFPHLKSPGGEGQCSQGFKVLVQHFGLPKSLGDKRIKGD